MNYGKGIPAMQQYNESSKPVERDPDGLCNLLSQATDRAAELNERLAKLGQHMSAVLIPEPPEPATTLGGGVANAHTTTSHAHDCLYTILMRLEQAANQIGNITGRFRG